MVNIALEIGGSTLDPLGLTPFVPLQGCRHFIPVEQPKFNSLLLQLGDVATIPPRTACEVGLTGADGEKRLHLAQRRGHHIADPLSPRGECSDELGLERLYPPPGPRFLA